MSTFGVWSPFSQVQGPCKNAFRQRSLTYRRPLRYQSLLRKILALEENARRLVSMDDLRIVRVGVILCEQDLVATLAVKEKFVSLGDH